MGKPFARALFAATLFAALAGPFLAGPALAVTAEAMLAQTRAQAAPAPPRQIDYKQWTSPAQLANGTFAGVRAVDGRLRMATPIGSLRYVDPYGHRTKTYAFGHWTSPWTSPGFGLSELVPSWDATTAKDTWLRIEVRGKGASGSSSWDTIANWAAGDSRFHRTNAGAQSDDMARVDTDTWKGNFSFEFQSWQMRVTLFRVAGSTATPYVDTVGAMTSRLPQVNGVRTSLPGVASGITLQVPTYSQMIHRGEYPQYGNGGEAWCSPTSTSMVLGYYDRLPSAREYAWVNVGYRDRFIDHAARMTYDYGYQGTGNWPFNTAYAATHADHAFVTRLRSLREAERFINAGIPVVASVTFGSGELDGAPISSTAGHLLVIVGFTNNGDVVVNDPAARRNSGVRRTYDRGQFEDAWLPQSGGLSYIIRTADQPLPERNGANNW